MRNVQKIPRPIRGVLKAVTPSRARARLHDLDYHIGQLISTYQHHLDLGSSSSLSDRFSVLARTTRRFIGRKRILCYPALPGPGSVFYKLCLHLGYAVTDNPNVSFDAVLKWENATFSPNDDKIEQIAAGTRVLNLGATDISKSHIIDVFEEAFGYPLGVDPLTYEGRLLKKSEINAAHDGEIFQAPLERKEEGYVYQRLVNNIDGDLAEDLRVPIFGDNIPFVRVKYRPAEKRFDHAGRSQVYDEVQPPGEVFTQTEQLRIFALCRAVGLDYGELDVLRDRDTGRIYVVDVNDTPTGPTFVSADRETIQWCFDAMAEALQACLFNHHSPHRATRRP